MNRSELEFNFNNNSFRVERDWEEMLQTAASSSSVQGVEFHQSSNSDWLHQGEDIDQLFYGFEPSQGPPVTPVSTTSGSSSSSIGAHFSNKSTKSRTSNNSMIGGIRKSPSPLLLQRGEMMLGSSSGVKNGLGGVGMTMTTSTTTNGSGRFLMSPPPISRVLVPPSSNMNTPISTSRFSPIASTFSPTGGYDALSMSAAKLSPMQSLDAVSSGATAMSKTKNLSSAISPSTSANLSFQSTASHSHALSEIAACVAQGNCV